MKKTTSDSKPKNIDQYIKWLKTKNTIVGNATKKQYKTTVRDLKDQFETSKFWKTFSENLSNYNTEYKKETGYYLLTNNEIPKVENKEFSPFLLKTFRINILKNPNFPEAPEGGWILKENWYSKINDTIRTMCMVKYIDGVIYLCNKIESLCDQCNTECEISYEAKDEGYYAAHITIIQKYEIQNYDNDWGSKLIEVPIEIQITTQLQEVIKNLLHKHYEVRRKNINQESNWKWDYTSDEFKTNYLGHILHYLEGMIIEIREKEGE